LEPITLIVLIAFAGPIIGSVIGTLRRPSFNFVCSMLCFAAGVMLVIALRMF
jgi:zinc transporter ZupT